MSMSLRRVSCERIVRGIALSGKEETKDVLKGFLSVRVKQDGLADSSVSSRADTIYKEICSNLDSYESYQNYIAQEGKGTLFYNSRVEITPFGEGTYILKIDIPYEKKKDIFEEHAARFLQKERTLQSIQILLNFWPFLPYFQMDFQKLISMFPKLPAFFSLDIDARNALDRFKFDKSVILAKRSDLNVKINLKGVNVFEKVRVQGSCFFAPYFVNQRINDRLKLFEEPVVVLSVVGKRDYIVDENTKREADTISNKIKKAFLEFVRSPENIREDILPLTLDEFFRYPFRPREYDDELLCRLFSKLWSLTLDRDITSTPEKLNLIKIRMKEIIEMWEQRDYIVSVNNDDSQPSEAVLCANRIKNEAGRITDILWLDPEEGTRHKEKLTNVRSIR